MKFTETSTETQTALLAVALSKVLDMVVGNYGKTEAKKFAAQVFKSIGLTEKEFTALFNPSDKSPKAVSEISSVTGVPKEMFHMIRLVFIDGEVTDTIMENQAGHFPEIKDLVVDAKSLGIVSDSMLSRKDSFSKRCLIADATYRYNKAHGTRHGMKAVPKEPKKSKYTVPPKRQLETSKSHKG